MPIDLQTEFQGMLAAAWDKPGSMPSEQFEQLQQAFYGGALCALKDLPPEDPHKQAIKLQIDNYLRNYKLRHGLR